jgi:TonB-linked SusC/RagA family outer membrane protein
MKVGYWGLAAMGAALMLLSPAATPLRAQGTVSGTVTSSDGQPLNQVRVVVVGANQTATTADDGKYTLHGVRAGNAEVQVLRVGYRSVKKNVNVANSSTTIADFQMSAAVAQLEEMVITATGQQRKSELGNAISTLGNVPKKVEQGAKVSTIQDALMAKAPGVIVLPASTMGGAPTVRIRGVSSISLTNSPIYYVDGVRYNSGDMDSGAPTNYSLLNALSAEEIEDIEIVKGPSAATLYGTNAANGVVLITTKKGRSGATHWQWTAEAGGISDRTDYQPQYANFGHAPGSTVPIRCQLGTMKSITPCVTDSVTSYDWMRDPSRTFVALGNRKMAGLSVSGGSSLVRFFASGNLENEVGPLEMPWWEHKRFDSIRVAVRDEWNHPEAMQRSNFRANLTTSPSSKVDISLNTGFMKMDNRLPPLDSQLEALYYVGVQNYGYKGCPGNAFPCGLDKIPNDPNGVPLYDALQYSVGDIMQQTNFSGLQRTTISSTTTYRPLTWLQNEGTVGIDLASLSLYRLCRLNECAPATSTRRIGNVTDNRANQRNFSAKVASTAAWNWRPTMNFKTSVGADYTNLEADTLNTTGQTLPPGATRVDQGATRNVNTSRQPTAVKTLGVFLQEQLSMRDRVFITGAIRSDQNSAFGTKFQRVYYPKLSLSWLASDETFFPVVPYLDELRLRFAYGASGVQPGAIAALQTFTSNTVSIASRTSTTGTDTPGLIASQPGDPLLKPETSAEFEGGFDSQMLSRRVYLDYTFYRKRTKDALVSVPIAPSAAAPQTSVLRNVGSTLNWGHEVTVNAQVYDSRAFGIDVTLNGSHNSNKWVSLGLGNDSLGRPIIIGAGQQTQQRPGYPLNAQFYRKYWYNDDNGDGILDVSEVHVSGGSADTALAFRGYNFPRDLFSIQLGADFLDKRFHVNASFDYKGGGNSVDGGNNFQCTTGPFACRETQDPKAPLWMQARAIAKTYGTNGIKAGASGYYQSNQFWKFRELSAVVGLPQAVNSRIRSQEGSSVVFSARNLFKWTSFSGLDPESNYGLTSAQNQNEFQTAVAPTYYTVRLNLKY